MNRKRGSGGERNGRKKKLVLAVKAENMWQK